MNKYIILIAVTAVFLGSINADARYLGKRYVGLGIGYVTPGDDAVKEFDDSIISYGANIRLPASTNIDFIANVGQAKIGGDMPVYDPYYNRTYIVDVDGTSTSVGGGIQIHFLPTEQVDPYLGVGFLWSKVEFESLGESTDDDDTGVVAGGGVEISINEQVSVSGGITYQSEMFDEDDILGGIGLNIWVKPQFLLSVSAEYGFDSEDFGISGGIGIGF